MKRMTGSAKKAKTKQRSMSKHKGRSGVVTLYHGTTPEAARKIRQEGLKTNIYSPTVNYMHGSHNTLTTSRQYAKRYAASDYKPTKLTRKNKQKRYAGMDDVVHVRRIKKNSVIRVKIPKKVASKYLYPGGTEGTLKYTLNPGDSRRYARSYGLKKPLPSKYIR